MPTESAGSRYSDPPPNPGDPFRVEGAGTVSFPESGSVQSVPPWSEWPFVLRLHD